MKKGDIVTIYHDPRTQQDVEGKAKLLHKEYDLGDGIEYWTVCFIGETDICSRKIVGLCRIRR